MKDEREEKEREGKSILHLSLTHISRDSFVTRSRLDSFIFSCNMRTHNYTCRVACVMFFSFYFCLFFSLSQEPAGEFAMFKQLEEAVM